MSLRNNCPTIIIKHTGALDLVFDDNFVFLSKSYDVTPHLNRLGETFQMRGHNIYFYAELTKIIPNYHQILPRSYVTIPNLA